MLPTIFQFIPHPTYPCSFLAFWNPTATYLQQYPCCSTTKNYCTPNITKRLQNLHTSKESTSIHKKYQPLTGKYKPLCYTSNYFGYEGETIPASPSRSTSLQEAFQNLLPPSWSYWASFLCTLLSLIIALCASCLIIPFLGRGKVLSSLLFKKRFSCLPFSSL